MTKENSQNSNTKNIWNKIPNIDEKESEEYGDMVANSAVSGINKKNESKGGA